MGACNYVSVYLVVEFVSGLMQVQSAPSAAGVRRAYIFSVRSDHDLTFDRLNIITYHPFRYTF